MNKDRYRSKRSLRQTIKHMVPAVFTALIATGLGFVALYTSPVPMIQDFGKMLTIGLIVSFILGVFILIPLLFVRDYFFLNVKKKKVNKTKKETGKVDIVLNWLTEQTIKFRWVIIGLAVILAVIGIWIDIDAEAETDVERFMPQDSQELQDIHQLRDILGSTDQVSLVYQGEDILNEQSLAWTEKISESILEQFPEEVVETKSIISILKRMNDNELPSESDIHDQVAEMPESQSKLFLNEEHSKGVITVGIKHLEATALEAFLNELNLYLDENSINSLKTTITGKYVLDVEMIKGLTTGRYQMTLIGMGLVFLSLLIIYRHPIKAFIPLLPIIFIVGWSGLAMYLLDISYTPLTATLGALIIGIGTEFTVLIMERFYEERKYGCESVKALKIANRSIGKAIIASALTTIGGFSALLVSDFVILNNFGMMTLINISLALFSTFIVMPPILMILGRFVKVKQI